MERTVHQKLGITIGLLTLGLWPYALAARQTSIETNVSAEASTGNQTAAEDGTVITGSSSAAVNIHTTVNGQDLEPVVLEQTSSSDEQRVDVTQKVQAEPNQPPQVETQVNVNGQARPVSVTPILDSPLSVAPTLGSATPVTPPTVTTPPQPPASPNFFHRIWKSITHFFNKLFSIFNT